MGGDSFFSKVSKRQSATATGTNAATSATVAGTTGLKLYATGIQCSGDTACVVTIESPASTVLWTKRFAAAFTMSEAFPPGVILSGTSGAAMLVKISASTTACEANIQTHGITG